MNNKKYTLRLTLRIIGVLIGIGCIVFGCITSNEELSAYLVGFGGGLTAIMILYISRLIKIKRNKEYAKKMNIELNDERTIMLYDKSLALTFRISILLECLAIFILEIMKYFTAAEIVAMALGGQIILYLVIYFILAKKM